MCRRNENLPFLRKYFRECTTQKCVITDLCLSKSVFGCTSISVGRDRQDGTFRVLVRHVLNCAICHRKTPQSRMRTSAHSSILIWLRKQSSRVGKRTCKNFTSVQCAFKSQNYVGWRGEARKGHPIDAIFYDASSVTLRITQEILKI